MKHFKSESIIGCILLVLMSGLSHAAPISIATNQWSPYINAEGEALGSAADLLRQVLSQDKLTINWQYQNYDLAFYLVAQGKQPAAFPYFKTAERAQKVYYSAPIFSVISHIYFNRQRENELNLTHLAGAKFGRVAGYSYGEVIDGYLADAIVFVSEKEALESLLANEIDFLPMTESVMNDMLNKAYRDEALLIKQVQGIEERDSLHIIAPRDEAGKTLINQVNQLLTQVADIQSLQPEPVARFQPKDIAQLVTAEGYPVIVGQTALTEQASYFTLPQGTRVLVLQWSDKILMPSATDRIYKSMIDLSFVVVLNGPHVGKELYIKNMHLKVQ